MTRVTTVTIWAIEVSYLLTKSLSLLDPPSTK